MQSEFEYTFDPINDFKKLLATLKKWAWMLVLLAVLGAASSYFYSRRQTPMYEATTSILVTRSSMPTVADLSQTLSLSQLVDTYARMLSSVEFLDIVSQRMGYPVKSDNVNVSALPNTQIIQLQVQDIDPPRAALTADTMVKVLEEQNAAMQAGRYAEVEQSLDAQIKDTEKLTANLQSNLDAAKSAALNEQIAQVSARINSIVDTIQDTTIELDQLKKLNWQTAQLQLEADKTRLSEQKALLDLLTANNEKLKSQNSLNPNAQAGVSDAATTGQQVSEVDANITQTRQIIQDIQKEIEFLTPISTEQSFLLAVTKKETLLKMQQSELMDYQEVYSTLLSTGQARSTNEIDSLQQSLALYRNTYVNLLNSREDIKKQKVQNTSPVEQIRPALASSKPVRPRTPLNTLLGGVAGLIIATVFLVLCEMMDDTIEDAKEASRLLSTTVIGYITNFNNGRFGKGIYVGRAPYSPVAEAFRALRTNLEFTTRGKPVKTILVTSGSSAEGKTTTASNLAATLSQTGKKVILVDANLRCPGIHQYAGVANGSGLSGLLGQENGNDIVRSIQKTDKFPNLDILPGGEKSPNPTDLLGSERMKDTLRALIDTYDFVVIDCPPILAADAQVLLHQVDGVVLIVVPGKTRKEVLHAVDEQVKRAGVQLLGVVFNRVRRAPWAG